MKIKIFFLISAMNALSYLCFGDYCNNCCDNCYECLKEKKNKNEEINKDKEIEEYEEIKEDENITIESLVNKSWYESKKENLVLKIF